jgi:AraC family transcriptional regulator
MDFRTDGLDDMKVICMEHRGPYNQIGGVFKKLWEFTQEHSLNVEDSKWLGIYWDDPSTVPEEELRSEACVTVGKKDQLPDSDDVTVRLLPRGRYLIGTHIGPYSGLGGAWGDLWTEIGRGGHTIRRSPCFELYIKGGDDGLPEEEWVTELCMPIE